MKVINLFGGPGCGKSTLAAEIFVMLKKQQKEVEYVTEYAKELCWEERQNILDDQLYVLAKQNRKIARLQNKGLEYVVTDSPILLGELYYKGTSKLLPELIFEIFNQYDNINYLVCRPNVPYKSIGRQQTLKQACIIDTRVLELLKFRNIHYKILSEENKAEIVCNDLIRQLRN